MKTLNIQVNDIAAISALGGSMLADIIAAQYKVIDDTKDASEMAMHCLRADPRKHRPGRLYQSRVQHGQPVTECQPALRAL